MTTKILFSSHGLGDIANDEIQNILQKYHLGALIKANKTKNGAMKQTMFVTSTEGVFVIKGNPVYKGQLEEEGFFISELGKRTNLSLPLPYKIDSSLEIFPYPYAIMPLLPGFHFLHIDNYTIEEKKEITTALVNALKEMHSWKVSTYGEWNPITKSLQPFEQSFDQWLHNRVTYWLKDAEKYSTITNEDWDWTSNFLNETLPYLSSLTRPTFVMGDFKPGNCLIDKNDDGWYVSGVFDFTNSYFGDPVADLIKFLTIFIDSNELGVAKHFIQSFYDDREDPYAFKQRLKLHMLQQRVLDWGCAKAMNMVDWEEDISFKAWITKYMNIIDKL
ncbi:phosphotransferase family protein [Lederbergia graminis]|uniref:Phosphotransferase family protein n=1 Tax=Lederbergia graminis TaxID=735518 RepID=A0ABW0LDZ2_9BACI